MMMIAQNFQRVTDQISAAAHAAGRDPAEVRLVVVTKGHPLEAVLEAIAAGAHHLGENYVEEAVEKIQSCQAGPDWHMIGHIQSRKAQAVCELFQCIHSLDSLKLARRLDRFAAELGRELPVLLECNVSGEESKFGWPAWQIEAWPTLLPDLAQLLDLPNLRVCGLMTMAPFLPDPEQTRPCFRRLRCLKAFLSREFPSAALQELSMGMSADYEVAIQEGATLVRIGTAIMGSRPAAHT